jgi:hypothetical protein
VLSLVHVLEWRAAVQPGSVALTDHLGAELTYADLAAEMDQAAARYAAALRAALREPFWTGQDRRVS